MGISLAPELRFLLACAHVKLSERQKREAAALLDEPLDVEQLEQQACTHGLSCLLYCGLLQLDMQPPQLAELMARLAQQMTEATALYEFVYPQQLASLVSAFADANIDVMVLKGYALGMQAYHQPTLRQYSDFDLLVREPDLRRAESILIELRYAADEGEHPRQWYEEMHHHIVPYVHPAALHVELHRTLTNAESRVHIDYDDLWSQAQPLPVGHTEAWMLPLEYQLLHLCIHAVHVHRIAEIGLRPLWDIHELVVNNAASLDWNRVVGTSAAWGAGRQAHLMLRLVNDLFGTVAAPETLTAMTSEPLDAALLRYTETSITAGEFPGLRQSSGLAEAWAQPGKLHRTRAVLHRLFPPRSVLAAHYGDASQDWRILLQYPRWLLTMARRHFLSGLRLLRRDPAILAAAQEENARIQLMGWLEGA